MPALSAADTQKAVRRNAATKVGFEFVEHEGGQLAAACVHVARKQAPPQPDQDQGVGPVEQLGLQGRYAATAEGTAT